MWNRGACHALVLFQKAKASGVEELNREMRSLQVERAAVHEDAAGGADPNAALRARGAKGLCECVYRLLATQPCIYAGPGGAGIFRSVQAILGSVKKVDHIRRIDQGSPGVVA